MPLDPADNTRAQRRRRLTPADLEARQHEEERPVGRLGRIKSWATILVAILALVILYLAFGRTQ